MRRVLPSYIAMLSVQLTMNVTLALLQLIETLGNPDINNEVISVTEGPNT